MRGACGHAKRAARQFVRPLRILKIGNRQRNLFAARIAITPSKKVIVKKVFGCKGERIHGGFLRESTYADSIAHNIAKGKPFYGFFPARFRVYIFCKTTKKAVWNLSELSIATICKTWYHGTIRVEWDYSTLLWQ